MVSLVTLPNCVCRAGGISLWAISPEERNKHDQKFDTLSPAMGHVSGTQTHTAAQTAGFILPTVLFLP